MPSEYIFVYGTLRKQAATVMHSVLYRLCEYYSDGTMQGKLYVVNEYPGATESDNVADRVCGELYKIINSELVFKQLDEYEECTDKYPAPHEYTRKKIPIRLTGGDVIIAWAYLFNHDVTHLLRIESGDYASYNKR